MIVKSKETIKELILLELSRYEEDLFGISWEKVETYSSLDELRQPEKLTGYDSDGITDIKVDLGLTIDIQNLQLYKKGKIIKSAPLYDSEAIEDVINTFIQETVLIIPKEETDKLVNFDFKKDTKITKISFKLVNCDDKFMTELSNVILRHCRLHSVELYDEKYEEDIELIKNTTA